MGYGNLIDGLKPQNRRANTIAKHGFPNRELPMPIHLFDHLPVA